MTNPALWAITGFTSSVDSGKEDIFKTNPVPPVYEEEASTGQQVIALTFDGGPEPEVTTRLLDVLDKNGAKATFFLEGRKVDARPELAKLILDRGYEVGNHSYNHPRLTELERAKIEKEILDTSAAIERATGTRPLFFRPPWGDWDLLVEEIANAAGLKMILWSFGTDDWRIPDPKIVADNLVHRAYHRAIAILHQHPHVPDALAIALPRLADKGYRFVAVSELIKHGDNAGATVAGS
ncbi:MAG TPA: polysaccharide deacetylase family protein [Clostridia bacterium]|nr:polysaccharide deacetylase family protein [Clostridia bacterium]